MDFVADQSTAGRKFRSLTVKDIYIREWLAIATKRRLKGEDVVLALNRINIKAEFRSFFTVAMERVLQPGVGALGLSERCAHGVFATWKANRQCLGKSLPPRRLEKATRSTVSDSQVWGICVLNSTLSAHGVSRLYGARSVAFLRSA
jgi:hypothetical protein